MSGKPEQPEIVRNARQLQRAHDVLLTILADEGMQEKVLGDDPERELTVKCMSTAADVLCWALGHKNDNFARNLIKLDFALHVAGVEIHDAGRLVWPGEDGDGPLPS